MIGVGILAYFLLGWGAVVHGGRKGRADCQKVTKNGGCEGKEATKVGLGIKFHWISSARSWHGDEVAI